MRNKLLHVGHELSNARKKSYSKNPLANYIRHDLPNAIVSATGKFNSSLLIKASAGAGQWAAVPWVALFDPLVTTTATEGYYIVYLFSATNPVVYLSLNQGTTAVTKEFGNQANKILKQRAIFMRQRLAEFQRYFDITQITLGSNLALPVGYESGHILGKQYDLTNLPDQETLDSDLCEIIRCYFTLTFRGGLHPSAELDGKSTKEELEEIRRYKMHRRIERNSQAAKKVKEYHGYDCQACGMNYEKKYGTIGRNFIEAHHLKPLSQLVEGEAVTYNIANDFAVLCANCHRMIHRMPLLNSIGDLKETISKTYN